MLKYHTGINVLGEVDSIYRPKCVLSYVGRKIIIDKTGDEFYMNGYRIGNAHDTFTKYKNMITNIGRFLDDSQFRHGLVVVQTLSPNVVIEGNLCKINNEQSVAINCATGELEYVDYDEYMTTHYNLVCSVQTMREERHSYWLSEWVPSFEVQDFDEAVWNLNREEASSSD